MNLVEAIESLRRQSTERGFGGKLSDFSVTLCEDRQTVSVWAFASLDVPLMAQFDLGKQVSEASFDPAPIREICERVGATP